MHTDLCYQGVRNVSFSEKMAYVLMILYYGLWIMDDPLFTSNSAANIFPYSFHIRKNNDQIKIVKSFRNGKIGSPFMI